jgi:transcriptional regulator with XRE-family HTH domain
MLGMVRKRPGKAGAFSLIGKEIPMDKSQWEAMQECYKDVEYDISRALTLLLEAKGWTSKDLADKFGVTVGIIDRMVAGEAGACDNAIRYLAHVFDIPASFIYVLADDPDKKPIGILQEIILQRIRNDDKDASQTEEKG